MGDFDVSNVSLSNREELHSRLAFELKVIVGLGDPAAGIRNSRLAGRRVWWFISRFCRGRKTRHERNAAAATR